MLKRLILTVSLLCVLTVPVLSGDTSNPGAEPTPTPTPTPCTGFCPEDPGATSRQSESADGLPVVIVFVFGGVVYVIELF